MYYQKTLTVPHNTIEWNPIERRLEVYPGITQHVWIGFPQGAAALTHLRVYHQTVQVWPTTRGESMAWDGYVFDYDDRYPIVSEPFEFVLKAWNEDDAYDHTIFFAVTIEHAFKEEEENVLVDLLEAFELLGTSEG